MNEAESVGGDSSYAERSSLARSITRSASKQTYFTIRLLLDGNLKDDCFRVYAYMRWVDDYVDVSSTTRDDRISFMDRQLELVENCYRNLLPADLSDEEQLIADVIFNCPDHEGKLASFINNMLAIIDFDANRRGRVISAQELDWYVNTLARSVTDGMQHFIGNGHPYPHSEDQYKAATAAHITHLLRDTYEDVKDGYFNVPAEYLNSHGIDSMNPEDPALRDWVNDRVSTARNLFQEGKRYIDQLEVYRCKVAGFWYCARFETLLDRIEADGYALRDNYGRRQKMASAVRMARTTIPMTVGHAIRAK